MRYSLLLCRFHTFFEILPTVFAFTIDAGFGEKCAVFMQSSLTESILCSRIHVLLRSNIPYILYSSRSYICQNYWRSDCETFP